MIGILCGKSKRGEQKYGKTNKAQSVCQKSGMDIKKQLTRKLIQATSDKVELNKQALKWKKSMEEAAKALGGGKKKPS